MSEYPTLSEQGKNLAQFVWQVMKKSMESETALMVSDEIANERMGICQSCERYDSKKNRCKECGCHLPMKVKFSLDSCPLNKWSSSADTWIEERFEQVVKEIGDTSV